MCSSDHSLVQATRAKTITRARTKAKSFLVFFMVVSSILDLYQNASKGGDTKGACLTPRVKPKAHGPSKQSSTFRILAIVSR